MTEDAPLKPLTAYAESKVRSEEALAELARRRLLAGLHAQRDRVRRLAAAPARHRPEQPRRLGIHDRRGPDPERRHALAARSSTSRTSRRATPRSSRRRARPSTARRSTSAPTRRTTRCASWPRSCGRSSRAARSSSAARATRTRARTGSTSGSCSARCPSFQTVRRARDGARGAPCRLSRRRPDVRRFRRIAVHPPQAASGAARRGQARPRPSVARMIFTELELPGAFVVDVETHEDERGHFARIFDERGIRQRWASQTSLACRSASPSTRSWGRCAGCTTRRSRTPRRSSSAASAARCTT